VDGKSRTLDELPAQGRSRTPLFAMGAVVLLGLGGVGGYLAFAGPGGGTIDGAGSSTTARASGTTAQAIDDPSAIEGAGTVDLGPASDAGAVALAAEPRADAATRLGAGATVRSGHRRSGVSDPAPVVPPVIPVVVREVPPVPPPTPAGVSAFDEGRRLFLANEVTGAIARFEQAARESPANPRVQKELGRAYMRAGNVPRAVAAYRRYLDLAPQASDRAIIERILEQSGG